MSTRKPELPIIPFASRNAWEVWLEERAATSEGLWLKLAKKGSGIDTVSFAEALEVGPVLRMDRRSVGRLRRPVLAATVYPTLAEEQVVEGQPWQVVEDNRGGVDETSRPAGGVAPQRRRTLGGDG
jgi:hypothetical protein